MEGLEAICAICPVPTINFRCFSFHSQSTTPSTETRIDRKFKKMFAFMWAVFLGIVYHVGHLVACRLERHPGVVIPVDVLHVTLALLAVVLLIGAYMIWVYIYASEEDPWRYFFFRSMTIIWYDVGIVALLVGTIASYSRHLSTIEAWTHTIYVVGAGVLVMYLIIGVVTSTSTSTAAAHPVDTASTDTASTDTASTAAPMASASTAHPLGTHREWYAESETICEYLEGTQHLEGFDEISGCFGV